MILGSKHVAVIIQVGVLILYVYNVLKMTKLWSKYVTMFEGNIDVLSRDFCCGKAISITYSECMPVARHMYSVCIACTPCWIVICGLSGSTGSFPHYVMKGTIFGEKSN